MANSLGELFIQLMFEGDTKEADKFIKKTQEIINVTNKEIQKNQLLLKFLKDIKNAQNELEKSDIKKKFKESIKELNLSQFEKQIKEAREEYLSVYKSTDNKAEKQVLKKNFAKQVQNIRNEKAVKETEEQRKAQEKQEQTINRISKGLALYVAAISGAIYAVKRLTDSLIQNNQTWLNLTRTSDIALSTFQKWNNIGRMYGIDNTAAQIKNLNDRLFELKLTGANAQGFILAGIKPTNTDDVMEQLRMRVSGLNDTSASYLLRQMGLDENMLHILRLSSEKFQALNNEVNRFQLTDEQRKNIQEMNVQLEIAGQKLQYLKDRIVLAILPYWTDFIQSITNISIMLSKAIVEIDKFIKKFRGIFFILSGFIKLPKKMFFIDLNPLINSTNKIRGIILGKLKPVISLFTKFRGIITGLISSITVFGSAIVKLGTVFTKALLPLTGLYLLLDDLAVFMNGGNSIIGDIVNYFKDFGKDFKNIFDIFNADPLYGLYAILVKIADVFIKIARSILKVVDIMFGTPFAKWLDNWLNSQNYEENLKNLRENLSDKSSQVKNGEFTKYSIPNINNVNNTSNNTNAPTINIKNDIHTTETSKAVIDSFLPYTNELKFTNRNFVPIGI